VLIVFLVWAAVAMPAIVWLGFVACVLLAAIFVRLGRRERISAEEDAKLYALAERLEQTGGFPRSRRR
jgi:hypothetical protein